MQNLDPSKAFDHDMIGIRMIKNYGKSIYKPLELFFINALTLVLFR